MIGTRMRGLSRLSSQITPDSYYKVTIINGDKEMAWHEI